MDEVSIWDAAATADEVASLYNSGAGLDLSGGIPVTSTLPSSIKGVGKFTSSEVKNVGGVSFSDIKTIMGAS
jgi:hypothetical protein